MKCFKRDFRKCIQGDRGRFSSNQNLFEDFEVDEAEIGKSRENKHLHIEEKFQSVRYNMREINKRRSSAAIFSVHSELNGK